MHTCKMVRDQGGKCYDTIFYLILINKHKHPQYMKTQVAFSHLFDRIKSPHDVQLEAWEVLHEHGLVLMF